ncbi:MAG: alkaline phosphatase family protein [Actinomycetota bacterium]
MIQRSVVIGLDGVTWRILDPLIESGHMPRLASLRSRGAWGVLESTVPTYTPPAWTSAITGVNPGRHGIYGFIEGHAQNERHELVHSGRIEAPTIWEMARAQGLRAGVYNVPLTYPPRELDGWMVSGMMTPGWGERQRGFTSWDKGSADLEARILKWVPDYAVDMSADWERDWRDAALADRALTILQQRYTVLDRLIQLDPPDLLFTVLETPDRLQHVYYRYLDPADPLYDTEAGRKLRPQVIACYEAMDRIVGLLDDYADDGGALVCSDHGFTAWESSVHTNTLLQQWGYLKLKARARLMQTSAARKAVPLAKRVLPARVAREAKIRTFAAVDWNRTRAFASPIPQQGVYINLKGRERLGVVEPGELQDLKEEIKRNFQELLGPDGRPVTDRVHLAEDVFEGDALDGAPDLLPVMRDHRFELDDELFHKQPITDLSHLPRGVHHPDGVVVVRGPGVKQTSELRGSIMDVTPTMLHLGDFAIPDGLDGSVLEDAFDPAAISNRPPRSISPPTSGPRDEGSPYSEDEEKQIEESLRGLGYI